MHPKRKNTIILQQNTASNSPQKSWDAQRFRDTYDMYYRVMVNYAQKFLDRQEDAEDVVQETFVRLWQRKDTTYGEDGYLRMLHTSVRNRCLDRLKHQAVERAYSSRVTLETEESLEEAIFAAEIYSRLFKEIERLPERQRETMRLVCEGKSNAEIAEAMSVGIETVKNQKYKAIATLRKTVGESAVMMLLPIILTD